MPYRDFIKGLALPLAVCVISCVAFLNLALPILILCTVFVLGCLGYSVWRLLLARQREFFGREADPIDRQASFYWLGTLIGCLLAPVGYVSFGVYSLRPMHYHPGAAASITESDRSQADCPLQYFVDGLPANFFGTVVHDQNKLFLVIHGCPQPVELHFPSTASNPDLLAFKDKLDKHSPNCAACWEYEPEVNVTGGLSVQSEPPGFSKNESGFVYDKTGKFVGTFFEQKAARFMFKLEVTATKEMHVGSMNTTS
jgi:hypothetical protein